jgi:hypothetical protein
MQKKVADANGEHLASMEETPSSSQHLSLLAKEWNGLVKRFEV